MFNDTFNKHVQEQLNLRSKFNDYQVQQWFSGKDDIEGFDEKHKKWISKYPYVFAYSNVRYANDDSYKKHSVLSSSPQLMIDIQKQNNIGQLYYGYIQDEQQGIIPRPVIKGLNIEGRGGSNHTVRQITMQIQCYSYQQVFDVRDYFGIPTMSVFIQYGNFVDQKEFQRTFLQPIMQGQLDYNEGEETYLNQDHLRDRYRESVNMDYIFGIISNFQYSQQQFNRYTLTVKMLARGLTFFLRHIDMRKLNYGSDSNINITKLLDRYIQDQIFTKNKEVVTLTNESKQKYVTLNWIANIILPLLRFISMGDSKLKPPLQYMRPMVKFNIQSGLDLKLNSNDKDIIFVHDMNCDYSSIHQTQFQQIRQTQQQIYFNFLPRLFQDSYQLRGHDIEDLPPLDMNIDPYLQFFDSVYSGCEGLYKKHKNETGQQIFSWFGNTYIRYQYIKDFFKDKQKVRVAQLIDNIQTKMKNSIGGFLDFSSSYNFRFGVLDFDQISKNIVKQQPYQIVNFGGGSIVKETTLDIQMPDILQKAIFQQNETLDKQLQKLFSNRGGYVPIDLLQYKGYDMSQVKAQQTQQQRTERIKKQNQQKQKKIKHQKQMIEAYKKTKYTYGNFVKVNTKSFQQSKVKQSITFMNSQENDRFNDKKSDEINELASSYRIQITLDLDFIANIQYGTVFTITFNPFGWGSKFVLIDIKHSFISSGGQTSITGRMIA